MEGLTGQLVGAETEARERVQRGREERGLVGSSGGSEEVLRRTCGAWEGRDGYAPRLCEDLRA